MNELQSKVLGLLKDIDALCRKYDIEYYLTAGTLIGAMRHKGFIPWDDDADIIMTRDNWKKFYNCVKNDLADGISLNSQDEDPNLATTANHYVDTRTTAIYRYDITNPEKNGIMIDVIIMDPVPDTEEAKKEYVEALTEYTELTTIPYQYSLRIGKKTHFEQNWTKKNSAGMRKTLDDITRTAFNHTEEESQLYAQRFAGSPHFWKKEYYGKPKYVPFEDTMLPVPQYAGECISIGYDDDWMYVPQGGPTKSTHEFCVRSLTIPGEYIQKDFESRIDKERVRNLYVKRKKLQIAQTENKFTETMNIHRFCAEYVRLVYKKKIASEDFHQYLESRNFDRLEDYFSLYIKYQCSNNFVGSSSLEGWVNWYRKCNPYLIDIGDDALYAVLELMMYRKRLSKVSKLLKARRAIDRPFSEELSQTERLYYLIKSATDAYEREEYEKCRELIDSSLSTYPINPYIWILDLKLAVHENADVQDIIERAGRGLELFPGDPEILYVMAVSYLHMDKLPEAYHIFSHLVKKTNNGIVLYSIRTEAEKLINRYPAQPEFYNLWLSVCSALGEEELPSVNELMPDVEHDVELMDLSLTEITPDADVEKDDLTPSDENHLTDVQKKRLELLCDLKRICTENGIRYYLFGKALLQAARNKRYIDENGHLVVAMRPDDCRRFIEKVKEENRSDRFLDSMAENPKMHRFCVRYGDKNTLEFDASQCANRNCGISVTIEILRNPAAGKFRNLVDQMLEAGWETRNMMKWTSVKRKISYYTVSALCVLLGEKRAGRYLFNRFLKGPKKKTGRYYIKPFWGERKYFDGFWFKYIRNVTLENEKFTTMKPFDLYLKSTFGAAWKTRRFPLTKSNSISEFADASVTSGEYLDHLAECGIDVDSVNRQRSIADRKYAPVVTMGAETARHWDIMNMCGERWRLLEKYAPMKLYIKELFRDNKISNLMKVLDDYYTTAMLYAKKGLGICFDTQIFEILEYCLRLNGKGKDAALIRKFIAPQDWNPISIGERKEDNGMRLATADDIPAISLYLKRHVSDCLYMYIDITKYGVDNPHMKVWVSSNNIGVDLVVMKYHTSISVYTDKQNWDAASVAELIDQEKVLSVTAKKDIIEKLYEVRQDHYDVVYGSVFSFTHYRPMNYDGVIETAETKDTLEIAKLIAMDEGIGSYYDIDNLAQQLAERIETGMGRSYIIRDEDEKIIAHIASYAEFDNLATTGGLIVHPDHQNGVLGIVLESYLVENLLKEKFKVYTFVTERLRKKLLLAVGNKCVGEYGKMTAKSENKE